MSTANERFKAVRQALGLSQGKMAQIIGLTKGGISELENTKRGISERHIRILDIMFGVNDNWLKTGEGDMFFDQSTRLQSLLEKKYRLTPNEAATITDIVCSAPDERRKLCETISIFVRGMQS